MCIGPHPTMAPVWTIRAIAVRTRDGPERLDQAYRLLLNTSRTDRPPVGLDGPCGTSDPSRVPDSRR
jgi:hypothetical protein